MNSDTRAQLAERLRFYRELGFEELYRPRPRLPGPVPQSPTEDRWAHTEMRPYIPDLFAPPSETLEQIRADLGECTRCKLHKGRTHIVFGQGNPKARVVFVGEGPGADEDAQGLAFVGRAGQLLTEMINNSAERMKVPLRREDVYICNVIKCRPPNNRTPERDEVDTCSPFLLRQLDAIQPQAIVALGATAARVLLGVNEPMHRLRGRWFDYRGARLLVTFHPAFLLRDPTKKKEAWQDMQELLKYLFRK